VIRIPSLCCSRHLGATAPLLFLGACSIVVNPDYPPDVSISGAPPYRAVAIESDRFQGSIHRQLRTAAEELGISDRIEPGAPYRLSGEVVDTRVSTSSGQVAWNVVNTITLLFMFGGPYVGASSASAEVELYKGDELIAHHTGTARSTWRISYELGARIPEAKQQSLERAEKLAVWNAVEALARSGGVSVVDPDVRVPKRKGRSTGGPPKAESPHVDAEVAPTPRVDRDS